jgi:hypothetical protein
MVVVQSQLRSWAGMLHGCGMGNLVTRNKMCMSQIFLNNPIDIIHLCLSFVQKWKVLARCSARLMMERLLEAGLKKVKEFKSLGIKLSDVEFYRLGVCSDQDGGVFMSF